MTLEQESDSCADIPHLSFLYQPPGDPTIDSDLAYLKNLNWAETAPGPITTWPRELLVLINLAMLSPQPQLFLLGPESIILYNTAYGRLLRDYHPLYQGRPISLNTALIAQEPAIERIVKHARDRSDLANEHHVLFFFPQDGRLEEVFLSATMVQLPLALDGFHATTYDTTKYAVQARRELSMDHIRHACKHAGDLPTLYASMLDGISRGNGDIAFAAIYHAESEMLCEKETGFISKKVSSDEFLLAGTVGSFPTALPSGIHARSDETWIKTLFKTIDTHTAELLQSLPLEMVQASRNRCYGDDCLQAVILPSVSDRAATVHAVLIVGLAPRRPYDNSYQSWIRTLHHKFCNDVASITISEARVLAKANDNKRLAREKEIFAKEVRLKQQEAALATGKMRRMLEIMEAASSDFEATVWVFLSVPLWDRSHKATLSGCSRDLTIQHETRLLDLCDSEDEPILKRDWQALLKGESVAMSLRFGPEGKERKWVQVTCVPVLDHSHQVVSITGCATDIDAQKQVEHEAIVKRAVALKQLHLSEARLLNLIENAPLGILIFDKAKGPSFVNKTWFQMTGHASVPVKNVDIRSIIFPEDVPDFDKNLENVWQTGEPASFHFRLNRLWTGVSDFLKQAWVQFTAFPEMLGSDSFQITTAITDISDFKLSEALQRRRLEEAVEARRQQENFVDMTSHEIRNPLSAVMHCTESLAHSLSEMNLLLYTTNCRPTADGDKTDITKRLYELNGNMVDAVETIMSCTMHQKRIIDDILSLSKLDSNLLEICPTVFQVSSFLTKVESTFKLEAAQAGVALVTIPDPSLSKLGVDYIEADPGRIMQVLVNLVVNAIKFTKDATGYKKVTVCIGASAKPPSDVFVDLAMVTQMPSRVNEATAATAVTETTAETLYLWCSVKDTGCGMDAASKKRIFSRFAQASPKTYGKYGGSGLGLFISRKLAALQGGEIGFTSQEDVGSTFAFYVKGTRAHPTEFALPLGISPGPAEVKGAAVQSTVVTRDQPEPKQKAQLSILLVEDNTVNQRVLKKQLQRHGYLVYTADNGQGAFDFIQTTKHWTNTANRSEPPPSIDIILMDIEMPIVDGLQCTGMIRAAQKDGLIDKHLSIVAVTANARPEQLRRAIEAGMDDSVSKPFQVKDLALVIERLSTGQRDGIAPLIVS
ncbi:sensory transduction histidine kinase [Pyrenophora seminiperda CCB06]|uniref:histidine kinase n=1 Tax=Pyrenophora seminiperda CCB06 TaxID=1302712 RepID=A0A3M7MAG1_9PLEO|nr:sensory transduction histidine kinase [Pyrenophora seminiperda CCB06]